MKVTFEFKKETPGAMQFTEVLPSAGAAPKIGSLYVKKPTLVQLDYQHGNRIVVTLDVEA